MDVDIDAGAGRVELRGSLDVRSVGRVRDALDLVLAGSRERDEPAVAGDVVVDLRELVALDAAGLGVLLAAHRKAQRHGRRLVLRGVQPPLLRTLAVTRLHRVLHVERPVPA